MESPSRTERRILALACALALAAVVFAGLGFAEPRARLSQFLLDKETDSNAVSTVKRGRDIFRNETFGDEAFWGDGIKLHQAIAGSSLGGVGPGVSPRTALSVGLKVDANAIPDAVAQAVRRGEVNLDDPA
ncbi:MAG TPA: hypothetical protein VF057_04850, partial [Thermoanaerobaculia bacterium]